MKITLFGASGKTGTEILKQAVSLGHELNAFVREASKLKTSDEGVKIFVGDVLDKQNLKEVLKDSDIVLIALAGDMGSGVKNIVDLAKSSKVKKIIHLSTYPMSGSEEGYQYMKSAGMDDSKIGELKSMIEDKLQQEKELIDSGLVYTIVRPTFLNDEPKKGDYQIHTGKVEFDAKRHNISRADVADFMLRAASSTLWDNKIVSISS